MTTQDQAKVAYALQQQIIKAQRESRMALWTLAEKLYEFEQMRGWLHLGHDTRTEWLADPEVSMTSGTYRRLVTTWRQLVVERKIEPKRLRQLEQSKLAIVVGSIVEGSVPIDEVLSDVQVLGAHDLREKYLDGATTKPLQIASANVGPGCAVNEVDVDGDADAEDACWLEVEQAVDSGAENPRLPRACLLTLLAARKARLTDRSAAPAAGTLV
jgi:hypothetical protein